MPAPHARLTLPLIAGLLGIGLAAGAAIGQERSLHPLIGCWKGVQIQDDGSESANAFYCRIFKDRMEVEPARSLNSAEKSLFSGISSTYNLDDTADPKQIDVTLDFGGDVKITWKGIYQLEGKQLKICVGNFERPTTFDSSEKEGRQLTIYQRVELNPCSKDAEEKK